MKHMYVEQFISTNLSVGDEEKMRYRESYCDEICLGNLFTSFFLPKGQRSFIDWCLNHLLILFYSFNSIQFIKASYEPILNWLDSITNCPYFWWKGSKSKVRKWVFHQWNNLWKESITYNLHWPRRRPVLVGAMSWRETKSRPISAWTEWFLIGRRKGGKLDLQSVGTSLELHGQSNHIHTGWLKNWPVVVLGFQNLFDWLYLRHPV